MKTGHVWLLAAVTAASLIAGNSAFAQARIQVGLYAGASKPTGTLSDQVDLGYHGGAFGTFKVTSQFGVRVDGAYNYFGSKDFPLDATTTATSKTTLSFATLNAQYDLGEEVVMAPGGGALPYISGGVGAYRFSFDDACTGTGCGGITFAPSSETHWGLNVGAGSVFHLSSFTPFVDIRYHSIFPRSGQSGRVSMFLASVGLRFP
ncbi:MAG: outer membrane beta-barrel protein [Gemmatimonadales bacterium]